MGVTFIRDILSFKQAPLHIRYPLLVYHNTYTGAASRLARNARQLRNSVPPQWIKERKNNFIRTPPKKRRENKESDRPKNKGLQCRRCYSL